MLCNTVQLEVRSEMSKLFVFEIFGKNFFLVEI